MGYPPGHRISTKLLNVNCGFCGITGAFCEQFGQFAHSLAPRLSAVRSFGLLLRLWTVKDTEKRRLIQLIPERKGVFEDKMLFKNTADLTNQPAVDNGAEDGSPLYSDKRSKEEQRQDHAQNAAAAIVYCFGFADGQVVFFRKFFDE